MLASDGTHLIGLWNENQKYHGQTLCGAAPEKHDLPVFETAKNWLNAYFNGQNPSIKDIPLAPMGASAFRKAVWDMLCAIPYGETVTYKAIAEKAAKHFGKSRMSAQAVGGAVGHNPISIIIPCHRVVGYKGSLTGYAGGLAKKIKLLQLEGVNTSQFSTPQKGTAL